MKPQTNTSVESQRLLTETLIAGLIATALALLVLSWLGREIVAGVTPEVDDALRRTIHSHASPRLTAVMIAASHYGGPSWLVPLGLWLAPGSASGGGHPRRRRVAQCPAQAGLRPHPPGSLLRLSPARFSQFSQWP